MSDAERKLDTVRGYLSVPLFSDATARWIVEELRKILHVSDTLHASSQQGEDDFEHARRLAGQTFP